MSFRPSSEHAGGGGTAETGANGTATWTLPISRTEFVVMLASIMALSALAIDTMLPALDAMGRDLGVTNENRTQLVIILFLFSVGVGSVIHGPLSDRYGRRPVLLVSLLLYAVTALGCVMAQDFATLLALRVAQGVACAAGNVITIAIIRDRLSGDAMARMTSTIFMVFMIVPVIAPTLGQFILTFGDWRTIFLLLAMASIAMTLWVLRRLPETRDPANIVPLTLPTILSGWGEVMRHRSAMGYMTAAALIQGGLYGFLASGPQIFRHVFHAPDLFPTAFAAIAITMACTNFLNSRIVMRFGARRVGHTAVCVFILLGSAQLIMALFATPTILGFIVPVALGISMVGLIGSNFSSIAMTPFGHIAGTASSFQSAVRTACGAIIGGAIGHAFNNSFVPLAAGFVGCGIAALIGVLIAERGRLFTRPGTAGHTPVP